MAGEQGKLGVALTTNDSVAEKESVSHVDAVPTATASSEMPVNIQVKHRNRAARSTVLSSDNDTGVPRVAVGESHNAEVVTPYAHSPQKSKSQQAVASSKPKAKDNASKTNAPSAKAVNSPTAPVKQGHKGSEQQAQAKASHSRQGDSLKRPERTKDAARSTDRARASDTAASRASRNSSKRTAPNARAAKPAARNTGSTARSNSAARSTSARSSGNSAKRTTSSAKSRTHEVGHPSTSDSSRKPRRTKSLPSNLDYQTLSRRPKRDDDLPIFETVVSTRYGGYEPPKPRSTLRTQIISVHTAKGTMMATPSSKRRAARRRSPR